MRLTLPEKRSLYSPSERFMFRKFAPAARVISNQHFTLIDIRQIRHHREEKTVAIAFILELPSEINQK